MESETYGKRFGDLTLRQLEIEIESAIRARLPKDARENMPIAKLIEAHLASLPRDGMFARAKIKCTPKCTVNSDGSWSCEISCEIEF